MFAKTIIDSDAFLDMPLSTQALYFHLSMRADDEGFINNPRKIQRMIGCSDDDMKVLVSKKFIIPFDSGIVVIKHWKIHNYIRGDRIKKTKYTDEASHLIENENGSYSFVAYEEFAALPEGDCESASTNSEIGDDVSEAFNADEVIAAWDEVSGACQSSDGQTTDKCQHRLGKVRLGKDSKDICTQPSRNSKPRFTKPTVEEVAEYIAEKGYSFDAESFVAHYESNGWKVGKNPMKSWRSACVTWEKNRKRDQGSSYGVDTSYDGWGDFA